MHMQIPVKSKARARLCFVHWDTSVVSLVALPPDARAQDFGLREDAESYLISHPQFEGWSRTTFHVINKSPNRPPHRCLTGNFKKIDDTRS